jgi:sugar/nucleoside kinase (ribokinase family)
MTRLQMINYFTIGGVTIDDTVSQDGQLIYAAAGGNALYSAIGARLWSEGVGIASCIGTDYPEKYLKAMMDGGLDLSGIRRTDGPSLHLWILYEQDGSRQIIPQKVSEDFVDCLDPIPTQIPQPYLDASMAHLSATGFDAQQKIAKYLHQQNLPISYDITQASMPSDGAEFGSLDNFAIQHCEFLLPSLAEIELIWGQKPSLSLFKQLSQNGPKLIVVKMGHEGSLVYNADKNQTFRIPIFPVDAVDSTGAGDAYCGGFMAGYGESESAVEAAVRGTVSASFAIEDFGALHLLNVRKNDAVDRINTVRKQVETVTGSY